MTGIALTLQPNCRRGLRSRCRRLGVILLCAVGLWAEGASAQPTPSRPWLSQFPIVSLPRQEALSRPDRVEETSQNLPFEVIFPPDRPKTDKPAKKDASSSYGAHQHWLTLAARSGDVCLRTSGGGSVGRSPVVGRAGVEDRDQVEFYSYSGYAEQIASVRAERLEQGETPELVVEDFFVSARAGHVRRASTTHVPLVKVAEMGSGFGVYAFREPHRLSLVLWAPGAAMILPNARSANAGCGLSRISLEIAGRSGVATSLAVGVPDTSAPEKIDGFRAWSQVPMQRAWRVSVSVSQTSRDLEPVLSLTFGDTSRPVRDALKQQMPNWNKVLGPDRARELEQKLAQRE